MTKRQILKALNHIESTGAGFWRRGSDNVIHIYLRMAHGNDPTAWINARAVENHFGARVREVKPDGQSGHVVVSIRGFYKAGAQS